MSKKVVLADSDSLACECDHPRSIAIHIPVSEYVALLFTLLLAYGIVGVLCTHPLSSPFQPFGGVESSSVGQVTLFVTPIQWVYFTTCLVLASVSVYVLVYAFKKVMTFLTYVAVAMAICVCVVAVMWFMRTPMESTRTSSSSSSNGMPGMEPDSTLTFAFTNVLGVIQQDSFFQRILYAGSTLFNSAPAPPPSVPVQ
jgi:amino acid transporter